jgi:zinc/manganese transport system substrate-binding protein
MHCAFWITTAARRAPTLLRRLSVWFGPGVALLATLGLGVGSAAAKVRVATSTNDLGSIAAAVGGDQVDVVPLCRPNADPHRVEVLPSYMVRVSRAQLYLKVGLSLDQWADQIIDGSHNSSLVIVDCSKGVPVLEKPAGKVDASMGDVHPDGNPHYWLDPRNGAIVAHTVAEALSRVDPAHASEFAARADDFAKQAEELQARGQQTIAGLPSRDIITYHRSWSYFANAFGLSVVSTIEPIPGIPPTGKHLQELVTVIQERRVPLVIEEPYFSEEAGEFLKRQTSIRVAQVSAACDDVSAGSYLSHLEALVAIVTGKTDAAAKN